jgi:hypothetical protein
MHCETVSPVLAKIPDRAEVIWQLWVFLSFLGYFFLFFAIFIPLFFM